jgi:hypothetical protein
LLAGELVWLISEWAPVLAAAETPEEISSLLELRWEDIVFLN